MSYDTWNNRLYNHFFNSGNEGKPSIIFVDEGLLDELGKELGGTIGFIESVVIVEKKPIHIADRFYDLLCSVKNCDNCGKKTPPFFGVVCLTILAWTVDKNLHGANYYERLNGLLNRAYHAYFMSKKNSGEGYVSKTYYLTVGKNINQRKDNKFRRCLEIAFKLLMLHTKVKYDSSYGFYEYPKSVANYVSIPRAQAQINAIDKAKLEEFFFERGIKPGLKLTHENAEFLLTNGGLKRISSATRNRWMLDDKNKSIIIEIVCSLVRYWDGTFQEVTRGMVENGRAKKHNLGAYLCPVLQLDEFGDGFNLLARIEFLNQDFPADADNPIEFKIKNQTKTARRHMGGWSTAIPIDEAEWEILNSSNFVIENDKNLIRYLKRTVYFFEANRELGGYSPTTVINTEFPYKILVEKIQASLFISNNKQYLTEILIQPKLDNWVLYDAKNGIKSIENVSGVYQRSISKIIELTGGAKIGHGLNHKFSRIVPPKIKLAGNIIKGAFIACMFQYGKTVPLIPENGENFIFNIPQEVLEETFIKIVICTEDGTVYNKYDEIEITLLKPSMPICVFEAYNGVKETNSSNLVLEKDYDFLYENENFNIEFTNCIKLHGKDQAFIIDNKKNSLNIRISHYLLDMKVLIDNEELSLFNESEKIISINDIAFGVHELLVSWHGVINKRVPFEIVEKPLIDVLVEGAECVENGNEWNCFVIENTDIVFRINCENRIIKELFVFVNNKNLDLESGCVFKRTNKILDHVCILWRGYTLFDKIYVYKKYPEILVGLKPSTGLKWKDTEIFDPANPPSFDVIWDNLDDEIYKKLNFYLGNELLSPIKQYGELLTYIIRSGKKVVGENMFFKAFIGNVQVQLSEQLQLSLIEKPKLDIIINGVEISKNNYLFNNKVNIEVRTNEKLCSLQKENLSLDINSHRFGCDISKKYELPKIIFNGEKNTFKVIIKLYWHKELIDKKEINVSQNENVNIELLGGYSFDGKSMMYPITSAPERIKIVGFKLITDLEVLFYREGAKKRKLKRDTNGELILGNYNKKPGANYISEVWLKNQKIYTKKFRLMGNQWKKIGFREGEYSQANEIVEWLPCWHVEKIGRKGFRFFCSGKCQEYQGICPCQKNDHYYMEKDFTTRQKMLWNHVIHHEKITINSEDIEKWKKFLKGIKKNKK